MVLRFAPSPTGKIHIGNFRTLLFTYLYCCFYNERFICRIDDTDILRNNIEYLKEILFILNIFNIHYFTYNQMSKFNIYKKYLNQLISLEYIYRCKCLDRKFCICYDKKYNDGVYILDYKKVLQNNKEISYIDCVYGEIKFTDDIYDIVLCRANMIPLYNFASVICDIEDKINIIIRGCDHIINTWKQLLIYYALGIDPPKFAHLSLLIGNDNKKLSKRSETTISIIDLLKLGYLRSAIKNYAILLGFNYKNLEFFNIEDLNNIFCIKYWSKNNAKYSLDKLLYLNKKHFQNLSYCEIINDFYLYLQVNDYNCQNINFDYIPLNLNRYSLMSQFYYDICCLSDFFYEKNFDVNISYLYTQIDIVKSMNDLFFIYDEDLNIAIRELCKIYVAKYVHTVFRVITLNVFDGLDTFSIINLLKYANIMHKFERYFQYILKNY